LPLRNLEEMERRIPFLATRMPERRQSEAFSKHFQAASES
jgi:hypothetical protein